MSTTGDIQKQHDEQTAPGPLPSSPADLPEVVIERGVAGRWYDWRELWRFRELLYFLSWRDIKVRYKQTTLGVAWAILQPLATMVVFSVFFSRLGSQREGAAPYPLFVLAGLLPWTFVAAAISAAGQSVVANHGLVTKVYFPRLIIPLSAVAASLVDFLVVLALLPFVMLYYQTPPSINLLWLPLIALGLGLAPLGVGALLSALTVAYRDFRHVVPFLVQLWMFATPAIYMQDRDALPSWSRALLPLNPADGLILNFRAAVLGTPIDFPALLISSAVSLLLLIVGCRYFQRTQRDFADVI